MGKHFEQSTATPLNRKTTTSNLYKKLAGHIPAELISSNKLFTLNVKVYTITVIKTICNPKYLNISFSLNISFVINKNETKDE